MQKQLGIHQSIMDEKCSFFFYLPSKHITITNCNCIFDLNLVLSQTRDTTMNTLKIDIVVIAKLFDLDNSCTNNHKHKVEIDKIPSNVNPTTLWAHIFAYGL